MPVQQKDVLDRITHVNIVHGVCGFVSVMTAMYERKKITFSNDTLEDIVAKRDIKQFIYTHIVEYLKKIQTAAPELITKINNFTQLFGGPYSSFTCQQYIDNNATTWTKDDISIAIPPDVVVDYIKRMFNISNVVKLNSSQKNKWGIGNSIIGFGDGDTEADIKHYTYRDRGEHIYNYGQDRSHTETVVVDKKTGSTKTIKVNTIKGYIEHCSYDSRWKNGAREVVHIRL